MLASSFIYQDILPSNNLTHLQKYDMNDWSSRIELEDGAEYCPQSSLPIINGHVLPKSLFCHAFESHHPPFHASILNLATGRDFVENSNRSPHDLGAPSFVAGSLIQRASLGSEDFILFDSVSTVERLSVMSASGCALSLLSPQSHISSSNSARIPMAQPLIGSSGHACHGVGNSSRRISGVSPQASTSGLSYKFNSTGVNFVQENHFGPILISDDSDAVNFSDGIFQGSQYRKSKDRLSFEDGPTIDLLPLSSHLQCVEHQRQSIQVKQENDAFCGFKIT